MANHKYVIYQIITRLFGNKKQNNAPWGSLQQNGVGKLHHLTNLALQEIKQLGVTHIWLTGIPHHASLTDYTQQGIVSDHPATVKGRAGSPYAIRDYYGVHPDLAIDPNHGIAEFEALVSRIHQAGLKVIIDIVPNHLARQYHSPNKPLHVRDFGSDDNSSLRYARDNNFYHLPSHTFKPPNTIKTDKPYQESPARVTGNHSLFVDSAKLAAPSSDDWYDTVRLNFGVRPDGQNDFPPLPIEIRYASRQSHAQFWRTQSVPDTWKKFRDITRFWLDKGVDGFRYDMAELVPVEFWSYLNSEIKQHSPKALLLAEIYQPDRYRDYIHTGKMDYLYDKVDLYDTLRRIMLDQQSVSAIVDLQARFADINQHLLGFLENHDEQRLASRDYLTHPERAKPALLICATLRNSPLLIYFGQEVGEPGAEVAGYGQPSRTSLFDYIGVPSHQRWMNHGRFDGGGLSSSERHLRSFYQQVLNFSIACPALKGSYHDLYTVNRTALGRAQEHCFLFSRSYATANDHLESFVIIATNFSLTEAYRFTITLPASLITALNLAPGIYPLTGRLATPYDISLRVDAGVGAIDLTLPPLAAYVYEYQP